MLFTYLHHHAVTLPTQQGTFYPRIETRRFVGIFFIPFPILPTLYLLDAYENFSSSDDIS